MNLIGRLRHVVPNQLKSKFVRITARFTPVRRYCELSNIYHCCVPKTGSQWIRRLLSDPRTYRWSGLRPVNGAELNRDSEGWVPVCKREKPEGFQANCIVGGLFISYEKFRQMKKPEDYVAFFIVRDPRELTVSWYISTRYTHPENRRVRKLRHAMMDMSDKEGILFAIDYWQKMGLYEILREWAKAPDQDANVRTLFFENLTGPNGFRYVREVFEYCQIDIPTNVLWSLYQDHDAKNIMSGGSKDKYRNVAKKNKMKWIQYFDPEIENCFLQTQPELVETLGYSW